MAQPVLKRMSQADFFTFAQGREDRWELVDGQPVMMAGANQRHQEIAANTLTTLRTQLRGSPCRTTAADSGVVSPGENVRYPDVVIDCGQRDDTSMKATTPTVVIEVLSPSTRAIDSHLKLTEYKSNPDIQCIILIDTDAICTLLHRRTDDGWEEIAFRDIGDVIDLPEVNAKLALRDVYEGLEFKPKSPIAVVCEECGNVPCSCGEGSTPRIS